MEFATVWWVARHYRVDNLSLNSKLMLLKNIINLYYSVLSISHFVLNIHKHSCPRPWQGVQGPSNFEYISLFHAKWIMANGHRENSLRSSAGVSRKKWVFFPVSRYNLSYRSLRELCYPRFSYPTAFNHFQWTLAETSVNFQLSALPLPTYNQFFLLTLWQDSAS